MTEFDKNKNQGFTLAKVYIFVDKLNAGNNLCKLAVIADLLEHDTERQILSARAEGEEKGIEKGRDEVRRNIIKNMLAMNFSI